jgi:hypothetical protein
MERKFVCDLCGKGFDRKEHLLRNKIRKNRKKKEIRDEIKNYK